MLKSNFNQSRDSDGSKPIDSYGDVTKVAREAIRALSSRISGTKGAKKVIKCLKADSSMSSGELEEDKNLVFPRSRYTITEILDDDEEGELDDDDSSIEGDRDDVETKVNKGWKGKGKSTSSESDKEDLGLKGNKERKAKGKAKGKGKGKSSVGDGNSGEGLGVDIVGSGSENGDGPKKTRSIVDWGLAACAHVKSILSEAGSDMSVSEFIRGLGTDSAALDLVNRRVNKMPGEVKKFVNSQGVLSVLKEEDGEDSKHIRGSDADLESDGGLGNDIVGEENTSPENDDMAWRDHQGSEAGEAYKVLLSMDIHRTMQVNEALIYIGQCMAVDEATESKRNKGSKKAGDRGTDESGTFGSPKAHRSSDSDFADVYASKKEMAFIGAVSAGTDVSLKAIHDTLVGSPELSARDAIEALYARRFTIRSRIEDACAACAKRLDELRESLSKATKEHAAASSEIAELDMKSTSKRKAEELMNRASYFQNLINNFRAEINGEIRTLSFLRDHSGAGGEMETASFAGNFRAGTKSGGADLSAHDDLMSEIDYHINQLKSLNVDEITGKVSRALRDADIVLSGLVGNRRSPGDRSNFAVRGSQARNNAREVIQSMIAYSADEDCESSQLVRLLACQSIYGVSVDTDKELAAEILDELDGLRGIVSSVIYSATRTQMVVRFGLESSRGRCVRITRAISSCFNVSDCVQFLDDYESPWTSDNELSLDEETIGSYWSWGSHLCATDIFDKYSANLKSDRVLRNTKAGKEVAMAIGAVTTFMGPRAPKPLVVYPSLCEYHGLEDLFEKDSGRFTEYRKDSPALYTRSACRLYAAAHNLPNSLSEIQRAKSFPGKYGGVHEFSQGDVGDINVVIYQYLGAKQCAVGSLFLNVAAVREANPSFLYPLYVLEGYPSGLRVVSPCRIMLEIVKVYKGEITTIIDETGIDAPSASRCEAFVERANRSKCSASIAAKYMSDDHCEFTFNASDIKVVSYLRSGVVTFVPELDSTMKDFAAGQSTAAQCPSAPLYAMFWNSFKSSATRVLKRLIRDVIGVRMRGNFRGSAKGRRSAGESESDEE